MIPHPRTLETGFLLKCGPREELRVNRNKGCSPHPVPTL